MPRTDANQLSLAIIRRVLDAAKPMELQIEGTSVRCQVDREEAGGWPDRELPGLESERDGPWPASVRARCVWEGGGCELEVEAGVWKGGRYSGMCGLRVGVYGRPRELVWITVPVAIQEASDGDEVVVPAHFGIVKRRKKETVADAVAKQRAAALKEVVSGSRLPLVSSSRIEAFKVALPEGSVLPSPEVAFRRLVHLALLKLEFLDRGPAAQARGAPLIDVAALVPQMHEEEAPDAEGTEDEEPPRRYWAGGFMHGQVSKLDEFVREGYWQIGWSKESQERAAKTTWRRFSEVSPGDYFAMKGLGGQHDLVIHYVGEVTEVHPEDGRLDLRPIDVPPYRDKAPSGSGAGNWFDTLVPVTRRQDIAALFGEKYGTDLVPDEVLELPRNLILYGPPGTGKTYRLQEELVPLFTRQPEQLSKRDEVPEAVASMTWFQVVALALHELGGSSDVDGLMEHPYVRAKYAENSAVKTPLRAFLWSALQLHTVEESTTVQHKRRAGELIFDKRKDSTWYLPHGLSDELADLAKQLRPAPQNQPMADYTFVVFHQSYTYEDFIEGIRPRVVESPDEEARLLYDLEDGVLKRAVRSAIRLAGFEGTIDDFCRLDSSERAKLLDGAPRYALFVDEISRGNVARIFGELISVIEEDKRLGEDNELIVTLPYSRTRFGVPSNLHIIGTMNTADRSVESLDTALRRRFAFEECPPRPELLDFLVDGDIDPRAMLSTINRRLLKLYDRDHQIGHAYLLHLSQDPTLEGLKQVFQRALIPLLQEYFYGDWGRIGLVLGKEFVRTHGLEDVSFAPFDHDESDALADRPTYELADITALTSTAFRRIYEDVADND